MIDIQKSFDLHYIKKNKVSGLLNRGFHYDEHFKSYEAGYKEALGINAEAAEQLMYDAFCCDKQRMPDVRRNIRYAIKQFLKSVGNYDSNKA
jgi:hypothetical protein